MKTIHGDLFDCPKQNDAICVTTNGIIKNNGSAVMGAGIAKEFAKRFPDVPQILGEKLANGNHVHHIKDINGYSIISFPTKNNWRDPSDMALIIQSCHELTDTVKKLDIKTCYIPLPGCGMGGLDPNEVIPAISTLLPDNIILVLR